METDIFRSDPEVIERRLIELQSHDILDGLCQLQGKAPEHAASREALASIGMALEGTPSAAARMVHFLSERLATRVLTDAASGDAGLLNLLGGDRLTEDPNANFFVKLYLSVAWAQIDKDKDPVRYRNARENLLSSLENLEGDSRVASNAALALARQFAALMLAEVTPELRQAGNMSTTEVSIFLRELTVRG